MLVCVVLALMSLYLDDWLYAFLPLCQPGFMTKCLFYAYMTIRLSLYICACLSFYLHDCMYFFPGLSIFIHAYLYACILSLILAYFVPDFAQMLTCLSALIYAFMLVCFYFCLRAFVSVFICLYGSMSLLPCPYACHYALMTNFAYCLSLSLICLTLCLSICHNACLPLCKSCFVCLRYALLFLYL